MRGECKAVAAREELSDSGAPYLMNKVTYDYMSATAATSSWNRLLHLIGDELVPAHAEFSRYSKEPRRDLKPVTSPVY